MVFDRRIFWAINPTSRLSTAVWYAAGTFSHWISVWSSLKEAYNFSRFCWESSCCHWGIRVKRAQHRAAKSHSTNTGAFDRSGSYLCPWDWADDGQNKEGKKYKPFLAKYLNAFFFFFLIETDPQILELKQIGIHVHFTNSVGPIYCGLKALWTL